jgi:ParB-like chromosome segregation protein Spo0J
MQLSDVEAWSMTMQENGHRKEVSAIDTAVSIEWAMEKFNLSQQDAAAVLHMRKEVVSNLLRVKRHPLLAARVQAGDHTIQSSLELLTIEPKEGSNEQKRKDWESFVNKTSKMSVAKIRKIIRQSTGAHNLIDSSLPALQAELSSQPLPTLVISGEGPESDGFLIDNTSLRVYPGNGASLLEGAIVLLAGYFSNRTVEVRVHGTTKSGQFDKATAALVPRYVMVSS